MSLPSSSFWGLTTAVVCRLTTEDEKGRFAPVRIREENLCPHTRLIPVEGMLGSKKSSDGGVLEKCLLGTSWRNARAEEEPEVVS